jgi:hypothetical protein
MICLVTQHNRHNQPQSRVTSVQMLKSSSPDHMLMHNQVCGRPLVYEGSSSQHCCASTTCTPPLYSIRWWRRQIMSVWCITFAPPKLSRPINDTGPCHASNQLSAAVASPADVCILDLGVRVGVQRLSNVLRSASMRTGGVNPFEQGDEAEVEKEPACAAGTQPQPEQHPCPVKRQHNCNAHTTGPTHCTELTRQPDL